MAIARWLVLLVEVHALLGLCFGLFFAWRGAGAIDPTARSGSPGFRALIVPGAAALWPLLLVRWRRARSERA